MYAAERSGKQRRAARGPGALAVTLALLCTVLLAAAAAAAARTMAPRLAVEAPRELRVGEHALVQLTVELPPEAAEPLLLTPFREGKSLDVVKGRLWRSDAIDPEARPLRFALPVLAIGPGTALIGVRLLAYVCAPGCRAVEAEASANVVVLER